MSRVERSAKPADSVLDALAQTALDYGVPEENISVGSREQPPGVIYYLRLEARRTRKEKFKPVIETEEGRLQVVGVQIENGTTVLTYRIG